MVSAPVLSMASLLNENTGLAVSASTRLMREPVTCTVSSVLGVSWAIAVVAIKAPEPKTKALCTAVLSFLRLIMIFHLVYVVMPILNIHSFNTGHPHY